MTGRIAGFFDDEEKQRALARELAEWHGTPFQHRQAVKKVGVDCVQLVGAIMQASGVVRDYDFGDYSLEWGQHSDHSIILEYIHRTGRCALLPVDDDARLGDIVCFKIGRCVQHCGIMLDALHFTHVLVRGTVTINQLDDETWAKRLAAIYRPLP